MSGSTPGGARRPTRGARRRLAGGAGAVIVAVAVIAALDTTPRAAAGLAVGGDFVASTSRPTVTSSTPVAAGGSASKPPAGAAPAGPAAPTPGFTARLEDLYSNIYGTYQASGAPALQAGNADRLPSPARYDSLVSTVAPKYMASLETALDQVNGWSGLSTTYHNLQQVAGAHPITSVAPTSLPRAPAVSQTPTAGSAHRSPPANPVAPAQATQVTPAQATPLDPSAPLGPTSVHATGQAVRSASAATGSSFPPPEPTGSFPAPPPAYQPTSPVGPTTGLYACPQGAPGGNFGEDSIYSATLAADELDFAVSLIPDTIPVPIATGVILNIDAVLPDPARIAAAALALSARIVADTFVQEQGAYTNCLQNNWPTYLSNIDNTTTNVYGLVTLMQTSLDQVESSINTVHDQVGVIQQTADESLTLGIEQALTAPGCSDANVSYELPASRGGNLDSTPIGVEEVVSSVLSEAASAGVPVNPVSRLDLALGEAALGAHNYKQAYRDLCNSYQEAAG